MFLRNVYLQLQGISLPNPENHNVGEKWRIKQIRSTDLMYPNMHSYEIDCRKYVVMKKLQTDQVEQNNLGKTNFKRSAFTLTYQHTLKELCYYLQVNVV
jgi:hypothetical protein